MTTPYVEIGAEIRLSAVESPSVKKDGTATLTVRHEPVPTGLNSAMVVPLMNSNTPVTGSVTIDVPPGPTRNCPPLGAPDFERVVKLPLLLSL